jgi:hypothetical protein
MPYQKPPIGSKLNYGHPLAKGLLLHFLFNEGSGGTIYDYAGGLYHGTVSGIAAQTLTSGWNNSPQGNVLILDGTDDSISVPGSLTLTYCTILLIVYRTGLGAAGSYAGICHSRSTAVSGINMFYNTERIGYTWNDAQYYYDAGITIPANKWALVALTVEPTQGVEYVCSENGIFRGANVVAHAVSTLNAILIGEDSFSTRHFAGWISDCRIYNRVLSKSEIANIYYDPYCMFERGFPIYWGAEEPPPSAFTPRIIMIM